jgi:hypothetical protein
MGLPIYLVVALVVSAAVLAVFIVGLYQIWTEMQFHQISLEVEKIVSEAETMAEHATRGAMKTIPVKFPSFLQFMVFGSLPNNSYPPGNRTLDKNLSNNFYFVTRDGRISTGHACVQFSSQNIDKIAVFYPGRYDLTLELSQQNGGAYVKIYRRQ